MSHWERLLNRTIVGLQRLRAAGQPVPDWVLGGGTALMIHAGHRVSKDIDAFIDDPQYLSFLSPRLGGESVWGCEAYSEAAHHLRLIFDEGEIDFIVAAPITDLPSERKMMDAIGERDGIASSISIEHPVETALKKLYYRGTMLKVRDIFDVSVVDTLFPELLRKNLYRVAHLKAGVLDRLSGISEKFLRAELDELAIAESWRKHASGCAERVREIVKAIPAPQY